ncbi:hypothetical protein KIW84_066401 [Lathyrus oleraceus]|uniref:Uncharacterized protein n=1 Tax=Pisum sativum TaxID=3888 RepID=A0A9D4WGV0_PEA|nr:hypothetical protein KIW84_066401 [Pisum sativum]
METNNQVMSHECERKLIGWVPPKLNCAKLNTDGACKENNIVGCGGVICGSQGEWLGGFGMPKGIVTGNKGGIGKQAYTLTKKKSLKSATSAPTTQASATQASEPATQAPNPAIHHLTLQFMHLTLQFMHLKLRFLTLKHVYLALKHMYLNQLHMYLKLELMYPNLKLRHLNLKPMYLLHKNLT